MAKAMDASKLYLMREKGQLCDIALCSQEGTLFRVHSCILAASSSLLYNHFFEQTTKSSLIDEEPNSGVLRIHGVTTETMKVTLDFIYGSIPTTMSDFKLLQVGSEILGVNSAIEFCRAEIQKLISAHVDKDSLHQEMIERNNVNKTLVHLGDEMIKNQSDITFTRTNTVNDEKSEAKSDHSKMCLNYDNVPSNYSTSVDIPNKTCTTLSNPSLSTEKKKQTKVGNHFGGLSDISGSAACLQERQECIMGEIYQGNEKKIDRVITEAEGQEKRREIDQMKEDLQNTNNPANNDQSYLNKEYQLFQYNTPNNQNPMFTNERNLGLNEFISDEEVSLLHTAVANLFSEQQEQYSSNQSDAANNNAADKSSINKHKLFISEKHDDLNPVSTFDNVIDSQPGNLQAIISGSSFDQNSNNLSQLSSDDNGFIKVKFGQENSCDSNNITGNLTIRENYRNNIHYATNSCNDVNCFHCSEFPHSISKEEESHSQIDDQYHNKDKPGFLCENCGMIFTSTQVLTTHQLKKHRKDKKDFKCHICGKYYATKGGLKNHIVYHSETRPHQCPMCESTFKVKSKLKSHVKVMHLEKGEKTYKCDYCNFQAPIRGNVNQHIRQLHRGLPIKVTDTKRKTIGQ